MRNGTSRRFYQKFLFWYCTQSPKPNHHVLFPSNDLIATLGARDASVTYYEKRSGPVNLKFDEVPPIRLTIILPTLKVYIRVSMAGKPSTTPHHGPATPPCQLIRVLQIRQSKAGWIQSRSPDFLPVGRGMSCPRRIHRNWLNPAVLGRSFHPRQKTCTSANFEFWLPVVNRAIHASRQSSTKNRLGVNALRR